MRGKAALGGSMAGVAHGCMEAWNDSSTTVSPVQNPEQTTDERGSTALQTMQDHLQQVTVMTQRRFQTIRSEHTVSKNKEDAAFEAMEDVTAARTPRRCEVHQRPKVQRSSRGRDTLPNAIQDVLGKAAALERHVKTVTMRTTERDVFQTILQRHEEAQNHLNALSAQLNTTAATTEHAPKVV